MKVLSNINIALRGIIEFGIVAAFACWGIETGGSTLMKTMLGILTPLIMFGFWGIVDFRNAGSAAETLRLIQELIISGLAAFSLYSINQPVLFWILIILSVIHHILVYVLGQKLIKVKNKNN